MQVALQCTSGVPIFSNGAQSAAIQYLFNETGDDYRKKDPEILDPFSDTDPLAVMDELDGGIGARNPANSVKLNKQLASQQQLKGTGVPVAGAGSKTPLRDTNRLTTQYGGKGSEWSKMSSSQHIAPDGRKFETHWYQNGSGQRFEQKTIISDYLRGLK